MQSSKLKVQSTAGAIVAALLTTALIAQDNGVKTSNAWVKLPTAGEMDAMAFVTIENPGMYEVNVTSAKRMSPARSRCEMPARP